MEFENCIVLSGPDLEPVYCRLLKVESGKIAFFEKGETCSQLENGGKIIMPGLYNSHTHMGDSALPDGATGLTLEQGFFRPGGYKYRELAKLNKEAHLEHIVNHLQYMAATGTICHLDFREQGAYGAALLREASEVTGVQSVILGQFDGVPFDASVLAENKARLPDAFVEELRALLAVSDGFSESTMNDLTDTAWKEIREITESSGKLRAIHCLENAGYREASLAMSGRGDLIRAIALYDPFIIVHLTVADEEEIALLVEHQCNVVLNPRANANLGLPLPPIAALMRSGVNLLLGTDNGMLNSPNLFAELDFTYKLAKSQFGNAVEPDPKDVLKMATSNIDSVIGNEPCGYLEVGMPADFVVLDFNQSHLRHTRNIHASICTRVTPEDVEMTVRGGRVLFQRDEPF